MLEARVFRVFISSTFSDLVAERDALQERVFPELRAYCARHGYGFQPVDLRWGIGEEASSGHRTMRICLAELRRCQEVSPRPNFLVLLGDRYGWRPLPEVIPADEVARLLPHLAIDAADLFGRCYARDANAVPPVYALRPRAEGPADWEWAQATLRPALDAAATRAGLDMAARAKYRASATEQEIIDGALTAPGAEDHVFCFVRETTGLPLVAEAYRDLHQPGVPDEEAAGMLADLKARLRARLPDNVFEYRAEWRADAPSTAHLDRLCEDATRALRTVIDEEIERLSRVTHAERERASQEAFAHDRTTTFVGRAAYLDDMAGYLDGMDPEPLCLFGAGGLGKSALVAAAAARAREVRPTAVVVARHLGVTSGSADLRSLLQDLCREIGEAYGADDPVPSAVADLVRELPRRMALASSARPLLVLLDALDQLPVGGLPVTSWLPLSLPAAVRLVVSTRPGTDLAALRERLPAGHLLELGPMSAEEGGTLLDAWLAAADRRLTSGQRAAILDRFAAQGSPLFLRLAVEEARRWPDTLQDVQLGSDILAVVGELFDRLEREHGRQLVGHALGFLACTHDRLGLSEDELLDALAADAETWAEFAAGARWELPARRLPVVVWSRLHFDLAPYLSPRAAEGASLLSFFHRELAEVAQRRYVEGRAAHLHGVLAGVLGVLARALGEDGRAWAGSPHALAELPYHLTAAERWDELYATLTDFTFLEAKAARVGVVTAAVEGREVTAYHGVLALLDDLDRALERMPAHGGGDGNAAPGSG